MLEKFSSMDNPEGSQSAHIFGEKKKKALHPRGLELCLGVHGYLLLVGCLEKIFMEPSERTDVFGIIQIKQLPVVGNVLDFVDSIWVYVLDASDDG